MDALTALFRPIPFPSVERLRKDPAAQAFSLLRMTFFALPLLMGIDKFAKVLNDNWPAYLAHPYNQIIPGSGQTAMYIVGVVEIVAALVVLIVPRFGSLLVAGWLAGIVASLLIVGGYGDIVLRDIALLLGSLTLFRLASVSFAASPAREVVDPRERRGVGSYDAGKPVTPRAADPVGHARVG